ncbi:hypothetical protein Hanom_Chr09g00794141 [Helianthus anomalus]
MFWERWLLVALLSSVSCFFCFSKIFSSVWMFRLSLIPFFFPTSEVSEDFAEGCCGLENPAFAFVGPLVLLLDQEPVSLTRDSLIPLMSACVSLYLALTMHLINSVCLLWLSPANSL